MQQSLEKEYRRLRKELLLQKFRIDCEHVLERLAERYKDTKQPWVVVKRVMSSLEDNTPLDWRFTEGPTSRFFVVDEETKAKFMGMSFRDSKKLNEILDYIQTNLDQVETILARIDEFAATYQDEVKNPKLPIMHQIRTVYHKGEKGGTISEEKRVFESARQELSHVLPILARKVAARPNAVVAKDGGGLRSHFSR